MDERPVSAGEPVSEAIATTGLLLNVGSVIAIAVSLASWGASDGVLATAAVIAAVLPFVASIVCFVAQAEDRSPQTIA